MLRTAVFLYIFTRLVNIHKSERNISLSCKTQKKHKMINILKNKAIKYFVDSDKELFDALYIDTRLEKPCRIPCKIYKTNKNDCIYLYLLNNYFNGAYPDNKFEPEKYGFQFSYYLTTIFDYENKDDDEKCLFVYLIKNNKINNIKIKIK